MQGLYRRYVDTASGQLHVREAGAGAPVLCLHPSPLHAGFLTPQISALAQAGLRAIGVDTPGHGASDPLPQADRLEDYADALLALADAMELGVFGVYGNATGAQLALALARRAPTRIDRLVLDNCGHFDPDLRAEWEPHYFPDLVPQADGAHLTQIWGMCLHQMTRFPWHIDDGVTDRPAPPLEVLQAMALAFQLAGPDYDRAYRLAFRSEDITSFAGLTTPTVLIDWDSSVVRAQVRALIDQGLPPCVRVAPAGPGLPARLAAITSAFTE